MEVFVLPRKEQIIILINMNLRFLDVKMNIIELSNPTFDMTFVFGFGLGGVCTIVVYMIWEAWNNRDK